METSLIRVCDARGETQGTGFVVSDTLAITCAHVVRNCGAKPGGRVRVVFHVNGEEREAEALLEFWRAPDGDDIAVLRVAGVMPPNVIPVRLGRISGTDGHRGATLGYPRVSTLQGVEGRGKIYRSVCEANGRRLIQLTSGEITAGFSGAPLLDQETGRVVGMITTIAKPDQYGRMGETAFATPAEVLHQLMLPLCPELRLHSPQAVEEYLKAVAKFCRDLPYVSLKSDILLETVYVRQQIRQEPQSRRRTSDEETVGEQQAAPDLRARPMAITQALEQHPRLVVVGGPGAGKSTLLRHLVQGLAEGTSDWRPHLPILVSLRRFAEREGDLTTILREQVRAELRGRLSLPTSLPEHFLTDWARQTDMPWLIALDGLDEIVNEGDRRTLIGQLKKAPWPLGSRVVITTRPDTTADLAGFTAFELLPFEPEQVKEFVHNWFKPDEAKARAFLDSLQAARLGDLSSTPLLLTVAAIVFEQAPQASPLAGFRRSKLYGEFVSILLDEDAASNRKMREQFCKQFRTDLGERLFDYRREVLESIALALQEGRDVRDALVECLQQIVGWRDQDAARKADDVLKILAQQRTGLVVLRGDRYEFIHPSFREYLTAAALVQACGRDLKMVWERIISRWREENWRDIALFALGILSDENIDVTPLLEQIWKGGEGDLYFVAAALADRVRVANDLASQIVSALRTLACNPVAGSRARLSAGVQLLELGKADDLRALAHGEAVHPMMRIAAAEQLVKLGETDEAIRTLLSLAQTGGHLTGVAAAKVLARLERVDDLWTLVHGEAVEANVRLFAMKALLWLGGVDNAVPVLLALAGNETVDGGVRTWAAEVLGDMGHTDDAVSVLLALAGNETVDGGVRVKAGWVLRRFGGVSVIPELERIAQQDANESVRGMAQFAAGYIRRRTPGK